MSVPYRLHDCVFKRADDNDLFVVSQNLGEITYLNRDRTTQAVLSIDHSMIEPEGKRIDEVLGDNSTKSLVASLGIGIILPGIEPNRMLNLEKLRYHSIILVPGDSEEGKYACLQTIIFFQLYMQPILGKGTVYIATPNRWTNMSDEYYEKVVMNKETRNNVQLPAFDSLDQTKATFDEIIEGRFKN